MIIKGTMQVQGRQENSIFPGAGFVQKAGAILI
jgi:hypothetical protein